MTASTYMPYGAFELKASYQRHMLFSMGMTIALACLVFISVWVVLSIEPGETTVVVPLTDEPVITKIDLPPPPQIEKPTPPISEEPLSPNTRFGIPTPVAIDEGYVDEDVVIARRDELAAMVGTPDLEGLTSTTAFIVEAEADTPLPTDFQPTDTPAEMIFSVKPVYPRLAKLSGLEGMVSVQAYVGIDGNVIKAQVGISSGSHLLDEAAVEAAYKNKYKPAVFNGQPVAVWVTYQVRFTLE